MVNVTDLTSLLESELFKDLEAFVTLREAQNDEKTPYKTLYGAADVCKKLDAKLQAAESEIQASDEHMPRLKLARAVVQCLQGLALAETDLLFDARKCLDSGTEPCVASAEGLYVSATSYSRWDQLVCTTALEACNALGALEMNRDEPGKAEAILKRGEALCDKLLANSGRDADSLNASLRRLAVQAEADDSQDPVFKSFIDKVRSVQTFNHYYLAQVVGSLDRKEESASYICSTLALQLRTNQWTPNDWLSNAIGMAVYFMEQEAWVTALLVFQSCVAFNQWAASKGQAPDEDLAAQLHSRLGRFYLRALGKSVVVRQRRIVESKRAPEPARRAPEELLGEVPATVFQMWQYLEGQVGRARDTCMEELPRQAALCDPSIVSTSYDAARDTFNEGMTWFKKALERFQLDGWVTDHFAVQLEVSALFRWLKEVDPNPKRKLAMDKERIKRLEPILKEINVNAFPGVAQSLWFELAQIHKDMVDVYMLQWEEMAGARSPHNKPAFSGPIAEAIAGCLETAATHYESFLSMAKEVEVIAALKKKDPPISEEDHESLEEDLYNAYTARMNLTRTLFQGSTVFANDLKRQVGYLQRAHKEAERLVAFCEKYPIERFSQEAELTAEFKQLIKEKLDRLAPSAK